MNKQLIASGLATALWAVAASAAAQSADLGTWNKAGDVLVTSPSTAVLTTAESFYSLEPTLSGTGALLYDQLEPALGITVGTLPNDTFEGSGLKLGFTTVTPTTISFNWSLDAAAYDTNFPDIADIAFAVIDGLSFQLLGTAGSFPVSGSFTQTFADAGSHALAFGVMDVMDVVGVSTLSISDFTVSTVSAVPEPGSLAMMLAGLVGVGAVARRRRVC